MASEDKHLFGLPDGAIDIQKEYDPEFLRHLRQPRPRDQPSDVPESFFTFDDALEDLMEVYSTGKVSDIHALASQRLFLRYKYPDGEPSLDQMARWSKHGAFSIRRHTSVLNGPVGAYLVPKGQGYALHVLDPKGPLLADAIKHEALRGFGFPTSGPSFPRDETELAEHTARKSSSSWWPSPFDTLWSLMGGGKRSGDGVGRGESSDTSSSEMVRVMIDEDGTTEEKVTEHTDGKGRQIKVVMERKLDSEGNVISETTRRFEDGKEKDVYDELQ
jgi:hypothetical protein